MVRRKHLLELIAIFGLINAITFTYGESRCVLKMYLTVFGTVSSHRLAPKRERI
jgi:hypothetical protein